MKTLFVGYMTQAHMEWEKLSPPIVAPSNYKDPVKIQEYINSKAESQKFEMADDMIAGIVESVVILDDGKELILPTKDFYEMMRKYVGTLTVGFGVNKLMKRVALEALEHDQTPPLWMWSQQPYLVNPAAIILTESASLGDVSRLLARLSIVADLSSAAGRAFAAKDLYERLGVSVV